VALGSRPAPNVIQPGHTKQRAVGPRWLKEPLAQLSWASSPRHRRRSRRSATRHVVARLSLSRSDDAARSWRGSAVLLDKRLLNGEGRATTRLVAACAAGPAVPATRGEEDALSKIAAEVSFFAGCASADRCDRTKPHAAESHGVTRATVAVARRAGAHSVRDVWHTGGVVRLRSAERARFYKTCVPGSTEPAPLLADLRRKLGRQGRLRSCGACHQHTTSSN
jgi:hypothetical protein